MTAGCCVEGEVWLVDGKRLDGDGLVLADWVEGSPPARGEDRVVARRNGRLARKRYFDGRVQSLVVWALAESVYGPRPNASVQALDRLRRMFGNGQVELTRVIDMPDGTVQKRSAGAELVDEFTAERFPVRAGRTYLAVAFDLFMADPFWRGVERKKRSGNGNLRLVNPGTVRDNDVRVVVEGPVSQPTVTNTTTGDTFTVDVTVPDGDVLTVDAREFTATITDGYGGVESVLGDVSRAQVEIMTVAPSTNHFTASGGTMHVRWRPAWL